MNVLIIDDDNTSQRFLGAMLSRQGYTCYYACNGYEGLRLLNESQFDVVMCDIVMPGINGYQVLAQIKRQFGNSVPVAVMSATESKEDMIAITQNAASLYFVKPVRMTDIRVLRSLFN